ncbi:hypothetical protein BBJ28_00004281 [Nothophytophthora sp. Chile5]|nr:hypothetical protein BBJ28_00004281 [Nothophytophthora sp. Chile5]
MSIELWADEDDDDDDGDDDDDDDDLADKQELMKGYDALGPLLEHAKDVAKQLKETAKVEGKKALATAWKYAELPPLRNRRLLRQHVIHVREMDADTHKYSLIRQRIASELDEAREAEKELQFGLKKRNKRQAPLLRRFQEMKLEADKLQQAQLTEDIEQRRRERVDLLKHEKQRQLDERQQRTIDQQVRRRQLNLKFWQKQLVEARTFAEQQTLNQQRTEEFDSKVEAMRQEIRQVEAEEAADADSGADRRVTTTSIGIFDTVFDPGEWHSATDGGDRRGLGSDAVCLSLCQSHNGWGIWSNFAEFDLLFVWQTDEYTIGLSSARAFVIENERKRNELMEIQSKVLMLREKLEQVDHAKTALALDRRTILERKDAMLQEIKQVRMEQDELNDLLAGPPRRDPSEREKRQFHTLVTRRAGYMKQLSDLDSRLSTLQKRSEIILRSEASFLPLLEGAEQMQTVLEAQVDALEETRHDLPMVVGKSIFQPEGVPIPAQVDGEGASITQPFLDPIKVLKQVTMESKLEILRTAAMPVNDHYKKAKATAIEAWKVNEHRALAEQELDDTKARLAKVRDHYIEHQTTSLRSDLAYAVRKFHTGDGLSFEFCGSRLCFKRLEDFREEETRERLLQREKHFVSELVKTIRMQAKRTSSQRATELLQELILVERSRAKLWDSSLFHGYSQRFKRAEYVNMLRGEIKKEVESCLACPNRVMDFQTRKSALLEPQKLAVTTLLGDYCSFKALQASADSSYRKETMIVGVRYEWREARTKLHVMHKNVNAVFLASACAPALARRREDEAASRILLAAKDEGIQQLQLETQQHLVEESEAVVREAKEDELLVQPMQQELARRARLFYADAIRLTTYNDSVSSQIDFQVQRQVNVLTQQGAASNPVVLEPIMGQLKASFARQYVHGKLALVRKTWERKAKRLASKRSKARAERAFRIQQEHQLVAEINADNDRELAKLRIEQGKRAKEVLCIPNFHRVIDSSRVECEHRELKAWGGKYGSGLKCKRCGKEMAQSFDDPAQMYGADRELDADIRQHRAQMTSGVSFRFRSADHLSRVENERLRLEKEAREMEESEALLYDRVAPKAIDDFDFRHGINRGTLLATADSSDPLYPRLIQEIHHASFQDEILFHGRLRNFHFRIQQIGQQHAEYSTRLALQREAGIVLAKLPLLELDQARAVALIEEDLNAQKCLEDATKRLTAAQLEREAARHAIEGVEEDAEFSEFHVPALVRSSEEMAAVYHRIQMEAETVDSQLLKSKERLAKAILEREGAQPLLSRLYCRTPKSILRTRFGFVRVEFYRTEDCCVVVKPLHWQATLYLPIDEILAFEAVYKEQESVEMAAEDASGHRFIRLEQAREALERRKMQVEEQQICDITAWRKTKEVEEQLLTSAVCREELEAQLKYETEDQKTTLESAKKEAIRLQRSGRIYPARKRRPLTQRPGRLDARRVTRASEKRLAMAAIERKLLEKERSLRQDSERQRNAGGMATLASEVFDSLLQDVTKELGEEQKQQSRYEAQERIRTNGAAVSTSQNGLPIRLNDETTLVRTQLGLERLWVARKKQYTLLHTTWRQEFAKLQLVRDEMARREELRRLAEEERLRLEARRKEMLAEERLTRRFYMEEMVLYIQERKAMATAEVEMREYLRQLELEAMKTKYAQMVEDRTRVNDKAARRLEIKLGKNEQHRLHREWRQIKDEDDLSMQIREQELARASAEALERQFDLFLADQAFQGQVSAELEANRVAARLLEAQHAAEEKRKNFKAKVTQERMIATVETFYCLTRVEVEWMEATERQQFWQLQATPLADKLRVMKPELERIQHERQHVVADATVKREMATKCRKRIVDADSSLEVAIQVKDKALFTYKKLHKLNATMDSAVLHDRMQRFRTSYLSQQLHQRYFALLVESVVRRALVEASEREIARLEDHIKQLEVERLVKGKEVGRLQRKRRRSQRLRLRRAELGAQMFGNSRKRVLKAMFERWAHLWTQRVRVRTSFKLKHELLLQKQKLTATSSSPLLKTQSLIRENQALPSLPTKLSTLHDHQKRLLRCRLCRVEYSEQQNTRFACVYHPGTFEFACIRTCETRQSAAKGPAAVPASCMLHRAKRWLCCDETEEGRHGSSGCKRRFHLPIRENPELKALVERTTKQEQTLLEKVNQQLLELQERNVVGKMKLATKAVVSKMEGELAKKRTTAAKFHTLDRRV